MAPTRSLKVSTAAGGILGKIQQGISSKRKADHSPVKNERVKRSALGNLTNALVSQDSDENLKKGLNASTTKQITDNAPKIQPISSRTRASNRTLTKRVTKVTCDQLPPPQHTAETSSKSNITEISVITTAVKPKQSGEVSTRTSRRISNEFEKTEESLYVSALEEIPSDISTRAKSDVEKTLSSSSDLSPQSSDDGKSDSEDVFSMALGSRLPLGVEDFDKENWSDPFQVSNYAQDIFEYLRKREHQYKVKDYISDQPELSKWMRSLLIDWMVEVQESFELNHETLYLAVKIVDTYLGKERVSKDGLQLLGAAALLIACKFDERTPPLIDDFLFICDGAYKRNQLLKMEITVFRAINFDLSFPLSYRFLRRYARCGKISMVALTLARYILEYALMDYSTIQLSDSKMACAALFMSLRMNDMEGWNATYEYYTGYKLADFAPIVVLLNTLLHRKPKETLSTVRNKYSHKIFHQVVSIPLLDINKLFDKFPEVAKKLSGSHLTYQSIIASCSSSPCKSQPLETKKIKPNTSKKHKTMPLPLIG